MRYAIAVSLIVAATVVFSLFSPAYRELQTEGLEQAPFELWVNGPLAEVDIERLRSLDPAALAVAVSEITPRYFEHGELRATVDSSRWVEQPAGLAAIYPSGLVTGGKQPTDLVSNEIALDDVTLSALGARIGDTVSGSFALATGELVDLEFVVAASVVSTAHLRSSAAGLLSASLRRVIPADTPTFSSYFVAPSDVDAYEAAALALGLEITVFRRRDLLSKAVAQANQFADPGRERLFVAVAIALLVVFVLRELRGMLTQRSRAIAVLIALGLPARRIARAIVLEQLVVLALALIAGMALGTAIFTAAFPFFPIPAESWIGVALGNAAMLLIATLVLVGFVFRQLRRVPIMRLLFEGS